MLRPNVSDIVVRNGSCPAWRIGSAGVPNLYADVMKVANMQKLEFCASAWEFKSPHPPHTRNQEEYKMKIIEKLTREEIESICTDS